MTKKILCLHGFAQNENSFKNLLNPLIKRLNNDDYKFEFLQGLFPIIGGDFDPNKAKNTELFSWSCSNPDNINDALNQAITYILNHIQINGPFDYILGFSQGAVTLSTLILLIFNSSHFDKYFNESLNLPNYDQLLNNIKSNLKGIILVSGYFKPFSHLPNLQELKCNLSTLHIIGEWDTVVIPERSEELVNYYTNSKVLKHTGGHFLPTQLSYLKQIENFLKTNS